MKNQKGFSLIELLIVVVIIGIIAAIAIPNLLASRRAANEASAMSVLRTINSAEATCQATAVKGANNYCTMKELADANLLDKTFSLASDAKRSGYKFNAAPVTGAISSGYDATAEPETGGTTGTRAFATTESGVIFATASGTYVKPTINHTDGTSATATPIQ